MNSTEIRKKLKTLKIVQVQIDPNGLCNAACWFCPVKYHGNPAKGKASMPIELFEKIIANLVKEQEDGLIDPAFNSIYTAHYNEVLLYQHFAEMLEVLRKYKFGTMLLSNGLPLTPQKVDLIRDYPDVMWGICLNIPAIDEDLWAARSGVDKKLFHKLVSNIEYAERHLEDMEKRGGFSIQVNGLNSATLLQNGGMVEMLPKSPELDVDMEFGELKQQSMKFKAMFPKLIINEYQFLIDRNGHLDKSGVISQQKAIKKYVQKEHTRVIGCAHGSEEGGRVFGWLHVNAVGDTILCCNDYDFETVFGNLAQRSLREVWLSDKHTEVIERSFNNFCTTCSSAVWGQGYS